MSWTKENTDKLIRLRFERRKWAEISEIIEGTTPTSCSSKYKRLSEGDKIPKEILHKKRNVLVVFDLHAPFTKSGYLEFCLEMYTKYDCSEVVFSGDIIDSHYSSYHETDADGLGGSDELDAAIEVLSKWHEAFPVAKVCDGNHDMIVRRKATTGGIPSRWIKPMTDVLNIPNWEFADEWIIDGVKYIHGLGMKISPRVNSEMCSVVQGHWHSDTQYITFVNEKELMFGIQGGCGVDRKSYAMAYGKHFKKPQINCAIVMDNGRWGIIEHMKLGE